jgi:hypothetical protein
MNPIAIFFQNEAPPAADSADIAFALKQAGHQVVTPVATPKAENTADWVFPDTLDGFSKAYAAGARVFWLNTALYSGHPVEKLKYPDVKFVGQLPADMQTFNDKFAMSTYLKKHKVPFATIAEISGAEITITVMPPGSYKIQGQVVQKEMAWALPPVRRAPKKGLLAEPEASSPAVRAAIVACERVGTLIENRAPIMIDCRQNSQGEYLVFDLSMRPIMTGRGRPGRDDQDSLSGIAARGIGWDYKDLLEAMLSQAWQGIISSQGYLRK